LDSINQYRVANALGATTFYPNGNRFRALIVEDDENTRLMYQAHFSLWAIPIDLVMYASAMEALLDIPAMHPEILLTDLNMPNIDGFEFLKTLREHKLFASMPIIVITGLSNEQIELRGGLPKDVQILQKPVDMEWLRGFLEALITIRNRGTV
jgi:DNA-binding response OmpR family regulator